MRRAKREVSSPAELHAILKQAHVVRVASHDDEGPFITPLNYGFDWSAISPEPMAGSLPTLWLHSADEGRKADAWLADPRVALELDVEAGVTTGDFACTYSFAYESIMATGHVHLVEDPAEKIHGLERIMAHMAPGAPVAFSPEAVARVAVWRIDLEHMTGKRREAQGMAAPSQPNATHNEGAPQYGSENQEPKTDTTAEAGSKPKTKKSDGKGKPSKKDKAKKLAKAIKDHKKADKKAREKRAAKLLDTKHCDGCGHSCKLSSPRCGHGRRERDKLLKRAGLA